MDEYYRPECVVCGGPVSRGPAPTGQRTKYFHLADTMEEAQTLDDDHKPEIESP